MGRDYEQFIQKIKGKTGIDLSLYKETQMKRRLMSLRDRKSFKDFGSFYEAMAQDHSLFEAFLDRMTINVTEFFRNAKRWTVLEEKILPRLIEEKKFGRLKVWSAACSTGEEPYTLAMILKKLIPSSDFSILATDLDEVALERAKKGIYSERSFKEMPKHFIDQYFTKGELGYHVNDELKKLVRFEQQNLLADRFQTDFDLIVCRNVMIYFVEEAKDELYHKFSNALRPGGVLFVGSTEQIMQPQKYHFETEDMFFYKKLSES